MDNLFDRILDDDEKIIKVFKPNKHRYLVVPSLFMWVIFGIISIGCLIGSIYSYFNVQNLEVFYMLLIFFIICLIIPLLFTITHLVSYKKTYYAYSNKKLLIKSGFIGDDYKVLDIDEVGSLDVVVNFFDKLSNKVETGQINFNSPSSPKGRNGEIQFGFFAIENPYEVYKEIKLVINQAKNKKEN